MIVWLFSPESCLKKFSCSRRAFYEHFSRVSSRFKALLSVRCILVLTCLGFGIIVWSFSPESCLKNSLVPRRAFYEQLSVVSSRLKSLLSVRCVLVLICLGIGIIVWLFSPESCLKKFSCS